MDAPERVVDPIEPWTPRQLEVLDLLADGRTNYEIAQQLGITLDGAKWHVREILGKLGVDSREAAAVYWRQHERPASRARRALQGLSGISRWRWLVPAGVATALTGFALIGLLAAVAGDDQAPTASSATAVAATAPTSAQPLSTPAATPSPLPSPVPVTAATRLAIPSGGLANATSGLLFLDPASGGAELWALPPGARGAHVNAVSADGRLVAWTQWTVAVIADPYPAEWIAPHILDTVTGIDRTPAYDGLPIYPVAFSPDGSRYIGALRSSQPWAIGVFDARSDGLRAMLGSRPSVTTSALNSPASPPINTLIAWSADGRSAAAVVAAPGSTEFSLLVDAQELPLPGILPQSFSWSPDGRQIAVSGRDDTERRYRAETLVVDVGDGTPAVLPVGGTNVRWSPDGRYVSVSDGVLHGGLRVFDVSTAVEVLRIAGAEVEHCLGPSWLADRNAIAVAPGRAVTVPDGSTVTLSSGLGFGFAAGLTSSDGIARIVLDGVRATVRVNGRDSATITLRDGAAWAPTNGTEWVPFTTAGRAMLTLDHTTPSGFCLEGATGALRIERPPFD